MISRRLLRIKILQVLYAYFKVDKQSIEASEKELFFSINKTHDLYVYFLLLLIEIVNYARSRIEIGKEKKIPTQEDLNPNTRFIDNKFIKHLQENEELNCYLNNRKLSWVNHPELIKKMYFQIKDSKIYQEYLENNDYSFDADKKIINQIISYEIAGFDQLYQALEEDSIYWNDDIEFILSIMVKSIKKYDPNNGQYPILPIFKDEDDIEFTKRLFRKTIINHIDYQGFIDEFAKNWEIERIAFMDRLIMLVAISEMIEFPNIPIKVSFNEYIEISKFYSTPKSSNFINGILDKIVQHLKKEKIIVKHGRGLIGEA